MRSNSDGLPIWVLQAFGLVMLTFFCVFWAFTGRIAPELLGAAGTLYGAGLLQRATGRILRDQGQQPPATPSPSDPLEERP